MTWLVKQNILWFTDYRLATITCDIQFHQIFYSCRQDINLEKEEWGLGFLVVWDCVISGYNNMDWHSIKCVVVSNQAVWGAGEIDTWKSGKHTNPGVTLHPTYDQNTLWHLIVNHMMVICWPLHEGKHLVPHKTFPITSFHIRHIPSLGST